MNPGYQSSHAVLVNYLESNFPGGCPGEQRLSWLSNFDQLCRSRYNYTGTKTLRSYPFRNDCENQLYRKKRYHILRQPKQSVQSSKWGYQVVFQKKAKTSPFIMLLLPVINLSQRCSGNIKKPKKTLPLYPCISQQIRV